MKLRFGTCDERSYGERHLHLGILYIIFDWEWRRWSVAFT